MKWLRMWTQTTPYHSNPRHCIFFKATKHSLIGFQIFICPSKNSWPGSCYCYIFLRHDAAELHFFSFLFCLKRPLMLLSVILKINVNRLLVFGTNPVFHELLIYVESTYNFVWDFLDWAGHGFCYNCHTTSLLPFQFY